MKDRHKILSKSKKTTLQTGRGTITRLKKSENDFATTDKEIL